MKTNHMLALLGLITAMFVGMTSGFDTMAFQMGIVTSLAVAIAPYLPTVSLPYAVAGCDDSIAQLT